MKLTKLFLSVALVVCSLASLNQAEAQGIDPNGWYRAERDIRGEYGDTQANGRRYSRVYVQVNRGDMVRGSDIQRLVNEGVAGSSSFSLQGRFVNGRLEPIKSATVPHATNQVGQAQIDPNGRYRIERDIRSSYVESAANGRRTGIVHVQANRGDVVSGREAQDLIRNRVASMSSFTKLRVGAVGLVAAGLLAPAEDSVASTVRVNGESPEAVRLESTNAGSAEKSLEDEAIASEPRKTYRTAK